GLQYFRFFRSDKTSEEPFAIFLVLKNHGNPRRVTADKIRNDFTILCQKFLAHDNAHMRKAKGNVLGREQDMGTPLLHSHQRRRSSDSTKDPSVLHGNSQFRLPTHLKNLDFLFGIQPCSAQKKTQNEISRRADPRHSQRTSAQVVDRLNLRLNGEVVSCRIYHPRHPYEIRPT